MTASLRKSPAAGGIQRSRKLAPGSKGFADCLVSLPVRDASLRKPSKVFALSTQVVEGDGEQTTLLLSRLGPSALMLLTFVLCGMLLPVTSTTILLGSIAACLFGSFSALVPLGIWAACELAPSARLDVTIAACGGAHVIGAVRKGGARNFSGQDGHSFRGQDLRLSMTADGGQSGTGVQLRDGNRRCRAVEGATRCSMLQ